MPSPALIMEHDSHVGFGTNATPTADDRNKPNRSIWPRNRCLREGDVRQALYKTNTSNANITIIFRPENTTITSKHSFQIYSTANKHSFEIY